jgi:uncharacterized protein (DUF302 family)
MDVEMAADFDHVVERTEAALSEEGFGVLCDIDVRAAFSERLDLDEAFRQYRILGACNPALAHEALGEETTLGALLPCNVVVYETDDGTVGVSAVDPVALLGVTDDADLTHIAENVRERFERVLASVAGE